MSISPRGSHGLGPNGPRARAPSLAPPAPADPPRILVCGGRDQRSAGQAVRRPGIVAGQRHLVHHLGPSGRRRGQPGRLDGSPRRRRDLRRPGPAPATWRTTGGSWPARASRVRPGRRPRGRDRLDRDHGGTGRRSAPCSPTGAPTCGCAAPTCRPGCSTARAALHLTGYTFFRAVAARGGPVAARPGPGPGARRHHRPGFGPPSLDRMGPAAFPALDRRRRGLLSQP